MTFKTLIPKYKEQDYNCAETILRAANEYYHLGIADEDFAMIGGFGGGMCSGGACGALTAGVAAIGKQEVKGKAYDSPHLKNKVAAFLKDFKATLGATECTQLRAMHRTEREGCLKTILLGAGVLQNFLEEK